MSSKISVKSIVAKGICGVARPYDQLCPIAACLNVVGEKWTFLIVRDLLSGPLRFSELQDRLPGISPNLLSARLRTLQLQGVVERRQYRELPPRVEYSLTPKGKALQPVLAAMMEWGARFAMPATEEGTPA